MIRNLFSFLLFSVFGAAFAHAQTPCGPVFSFVEMGITVGRETNFNEGYAKDLEWHKQQADNWTWLGWYVSGGERNGLFIDASPCHQWTDFDNWKINGTDNGKHNRIHYLSHINSLKSFYRVLLPEHSKVQPNWYSSPLLLTVYVQLAAVDEATQNTVAQMIGRQLSQKNIPQYALMRQSFGGEIPTLVLHIPAKNIGEAGQYEPVLTALFTDSKEFSPRALVRSVKSEIWRYRADLSYHPESK